MAVSLDVDVSAAFLRLDAIGPNVHQALLDELAPLVDEIAGDARGIALAHTHTYGDQPGLYLASIYGGVSDRGSKVAGYVRSASPLAHLLEYGADLPARLIEASVAEVLAFEGDAGKVFRREVHFPGAHVPPYPAIHPAFEDHRADIEAALERVAEKAGS